MKNDLPRKTDLLRLKYSKKFYSSYDVFDLFINLIIDVYI